MRAGREGEGIGTPSANERVLSCMDTLHEHYNTYAGYYQKSPGKQPSYHHSSELYPLLFHD